MVQKTKSRFMDTCRLLKMEAWDTDDFDREVTAYFQL
jgi:hypothetical protein